MSKTVTQSLHDSVEVHLRNSGRASRCGQSLEIICTDITEGRHRWAECRMHTLLSGSACSARVLVRLLQLHGSGIDLCVQRHCPDAILLHLHMVSSLGNRV